MKKISFAWDGATSAQHKAPASLISEIEQVQKAAPDLNYKTSQASVALAHDSQMHKNVMRVVTEKQKLNPAALVVIGIGGSSLGTEAVWHACKEYLEQRPIQFFCADTVAPDQIAAILATCNALLSQGKTVIVTIISKSGTTTETIANATLFVHLLKQHHPKRYAEYIVAITDKNSKLWHLAAQEQFSLLEIPKEVGGRYSVLSPVGLFPLALLGIDINELVTGAREIQESCTSTSLEKNPAAMTALLLHEHYMKGVVISDLFLFAPHLESLGKWYRQLMAESIGKQKSENGNITHIGITPTVSIGTNDLHSMVQLYLAGPRIRFTTFVSVETSRYDVRIPHMPGFVDLVEGITDKSLTHLMHAIEKGVQKSYKNLELPYVTLSLPDSSARSIGQFMHYQMLVIMYLAKLLDIPAFDQPQVELYKQETRRILAHE